MPPVNRLAIRTEAAPRRISQFLFQEPRLKRDQLRVVRTGIVSKPSQRLGEYTFFVWPFVDHLSVKCSNLNDHNSRRTTCRFADAGVYRGGTVKPRESSTMKLAVI